MDGGDGGTTMKMDLVPLNRAFKKMVKIIRFVLCIFDNLTYPIWI